MIRSLAQLLSAALFAGFALNAAPAHAQTLCAYDPAGKSGDFFRILGDYALEAGKWGANIELKAYTDEETAAKDFAAGQCDGVVATGVRLQRFNNFPSTFEAVGALPDYQSERQLISSFAKYPSAAKKLTRGEFQTVGFIPAGAVYLFVRDRSIDSVSKLAGKRIATMDYDKAAPYVVNKMGAIVVPADLGSIGPKFNNGDVDICYMSAPGYGPFELHKGLANGGGIIRAPLAQASFQVLIRKNKFPEGFGSKSLTYWASNFDKALEAVRKAEAKIPSSMWIDVPKAKLSDWDAIYQDVRVELRDKGAYDASLLKVMKKIRCGRDASRAECAENRE